MSKNYKSWNKGKKGLQKHSLETREKIRQAHLGKKHILTEAGKKSFKEKMSGKNSPVWVNGNYKKSENKMLDSAYMYWSIEVKKRDGWKCKLLNNECKGRLEAHHIYSWRDYPTLRYVLTNGITLCQFHHPRKWEEEKRMIPIFQELLSVSKEQN